VIASAAEPSCLRLAKANGARLLMQPYRIEGVGELAFVEDRESHRVGVRQ
jgi:hypothetical protein